ncbi:MAG: ATP-binding protein [Candidatus Binatia bacterium]
MDKGHSFAPRSSVATMLCGGSIVVLGLVVLVGWRTETLVLTQVVPAFVPMAPLAALAFVLSGIGLVAVATHWPMTARIIGVVTSALGGGTVLQSLFDVHWGLEHVMMGSASPVGYVYPRMALTTALGFIFGGAALLLVQRPSGRHASHTRVVLPKWPTLRQGMATFAGGMVALLGIATLVLYLSGVMKIHEWGRVTPIMALHGAVGFVMLGSGLLALTWQDRAFASVRAVSWLPAGVGATVATLTLMLWQALTVYEHEQIERGVTVAARYVKSEITTRLDAHILALVRVARRWENSGPIPQQQWEFEAGLNLPHFPGYQTIAWVNSSYQTRWVVSRDASQVPGVLHQAFAVWRQRVHAGTLDQHTVMVTPPLNLTQGTKEFAVIVPIFREENLEGFIAGVINFYEMFSILLKNIVPGYALSLLDGTAEIYHRDADMGDNREATAWSQEITITPYGVSWKGLIWPLPEELATEKSALPEVTLGLGFFLAAILAWLTTDILARKQAETALQRAHAELEQRVHERTAELATANEDLRVENLERKRAEEALVRQAHELARSNAELEQFAHVASHDLQEPLRKILTFGERLKTRCAEALDEQGRDYLDRMQAAAARMQTLIHDILTLSRIATNPRPFVPVDLSVTAREVMSDLEVRVQQLGAEVSIGRLPTIDADPLQMHQLLQNLISNALKFQGPDQRPCVTVQGAIAPAQEAGNGHYPAAVAHCQLTVQDNGIGFDEKYLDRIFAPFQRVHGRAKYEGTGMGLAICRKIVERHGGTITGRSLPGQGATFIATLPVTQARGTAT